MSAWDETRAGEGDIPTEAVGMVVAARLDLAERRFSSPIGVLITWSTVSYIRKLLAASLDDREDA